LHLKPLPVIQDTLLGRFLWNLEERLHLPHLGVLLRITDQFLSRLIVFNEAQSKGGLCSSGARVWPLGSHGQQISKCWRCPRWVNRLCGAFGKPPKDSDKRELWSSEQGYAFCIRE
jgi:hypothetical protein